jgi:RNA polymerase sigma-70 factor (ECF subfamily)
VKKRASLLVVERSEVESVSAQLAEDAPAAPRDGAAVPSLEQLYRDHAPRYRRVAEAILGDEDAAQDVVQDAFARAVLRRASFAARGDAAAWLWRIVVNTALSRRRRAQVERRALALIGLDRAETDEISSVAGLRVQVAALPRRQRVAIYLRYYADLDYDAIARVLGVSPGTVGKLLHDARRTLGRRIGKDDARG